MEQLDQQLLLLLNGSQSTFLDNCFLLITRTSTWIPLFIILLIIVYHHYHACGFSRRSHSPFLLLLLFIIASALVIIICDQTASTICKPLFARPRPSHEPALLGLVDLVNGRRGGAYGFFSSHAANTFGIATFTALTLRKPIINITLYVWALLSSYSRIYLGLHYPGDILVGITFGILVAYIIYRLSKPLFKINQQTTTNNTSTLPQLKSSAFNIQYALPTAFIATLLVIAIIAL